jgi:integrase
MMTEAPPREEPALPTAARGWGELVERYVEKRSQESLSAHHLQELRRVLKKAGRELDALGLACLPAKFEDAQLDFLLNGPWRPATENQTGLPPVSRRYLACILNGFLKESGNLIIERRRLRFPRSGVRPLLALTPEEAGRLLDVAATFGVVTHAVIAFEMLMGLRRSEVRRITAADLGERFLRVHGKGRAGGKVRMVPYHPEVLQILPSLLQHRRQVVEGYRGPHPGYLFVRRSSKGLVVWSRSWLDERIMQPVFEAASVRRAWNLHHALRRTSGRTMWKNGVPIETVSKILGHADVRMTIRYLAIDQDDMAQAMEVLGRVLPGARVA